MKLNKNVLFNVCAAIFVIAFFFVSVRVVLRSGPGRSHRMIEGHCFDRRVEDLTDVFKNWRRTWDESRPECLRAAELLQELFHLEVRTGSLTVPDDMEPVVRGWLGNDPNLYENFFNQSLLFVNNRWLSTTTVRNPLRASKPRQKKGNKS